MSGKKRKEKVCFGEAAVEGCVMAGWLDMLEGSISCFICLFPYLHRLHINPNKDSTRGKSRHHRSHEGGVSMGLVSSFRAYWVL